jgi:gluconate 2-dehydrogenase gamma chain
VADDPQLPAGIDSAPRELVSRRFFLYHVAFWGGGAVLLGPACSLLEGKKPPPSAAPPGGRRSFVTAHRSFTNEEWPVLLAACDRALPRDQDPGALDAGVPEYIDRMLLTPELAEMRGDFINGLQLLDGRSRAEHGKGFAEIPSEQQDALLKDFRTRPTDTPEGHFFELLMVFTLEGFLGDPSYGGNKDRVGWTLVGFDTSMPADYQPGQPMVHIHQREKAGG